MEIGKVSNQILQKIILDKIKTKRDEMILTPKIGEDCCAVDFGEYICVLSTDPITGAVQEVGRLAVHISCNDIASCGVEPIGLMVTILSPPGTTEAELEMIMGQIIETANSLNVDIIGGHTEITDAVNRFVISSVAIGKTLKDKLVKTSGAQVGDQVILTKTAGIEGTAIIAHDMSKELIEHFGDAFIAKAQSYMNNISVVKEGIIAGRFGVTSMHDVTEGGILGAAWELSEASGVGVKINHTNIPIKYETLKIAEYFQIDPLKLISSGCMMITCKDGIGLVNQLCENGVDASIIGEITVEKEKILYTEKGWVEICQPASDELYKVIRKKEA